MFAAFSKLADIMSSKTSGQCNAEGTEVEFQHEAYTVSTQNDLIIQASAAEPHAPRTKRVTGPPDPYKDSNFPAHGAREKVDKSPAKAAKKPAAAPTNAAAAPTKAAAALKKAAAAPTKAPKQSAQLPKYFEAGNSLCVDGCTYTIVSLLYQTLQVVVLRAECVSGKHAGEPAVLKAQPRHKNTVLQVTTECQMLAPIQQKAPLMRVQKLLGYQMITQKGEKEQNEDWYVLASRDAGRALSEYAKNQKHTSMQRIFFVGYQLLHTLRQLHEIGVLHRDIKQQNVTICPQTGHECLIDFGTCDSVNDRRGQRKTTPQIKAEGTAQYMSIHVHNKDPLGERDDVWSLLFMLLEMAVGHLPWHYDKVTEMCDKKKAYVRTHFANTENSAPDGMDPVLHRCFCALFAHAQSLKTPQSSPDYAMLQTIIQKSWDAANLKPDISRAKF
jgi:serine/threonine protein kinase